MIHNYKDILRKGRRCHTAGNTKNGPRDVVDDISWAVGKFFFIYTTFNNTNWTLDFIFTDDDIAAMPSHQCSQPPPDNGGHVTPFFLGILPFVYCAFCTKWLIIALSTTSCSKGTTTNGHLHRQPMRQHMSPAFPPLPLPPSESTPPLLPTNVSPLSTTATLTDNGAILPTPTAAAEPPLQMDMTGMVWEGWWPETGVAAAAAAEK